MPIVSNINGGYIYNKNNNVTYFIGSTTDQELLTILLTQVTKKIFFLKQKEI